MKFALHPKTWTRTWTAPEISNSDLITLQHYGIRNFGLVCLSVGSLKNTGTPLQSQVALVVPCQPTNKHTAIQFLEGELFGSYS